MIGKKMIIWRESIMLTSHSASLSTAPRRSLCVQNSSVAETSSKLTATSSVLSSPTRCRSSSRSAKSSVCRYSRRISSCVYRVLVPMSLSSMRLGLNCKIGGKEA